MSLSLTRAGIKHDEEAPKLAQSGRTILFDTSSNGRVLLKNMAALELSPGSVDLVFLSHPHWDHIGGLDSFLEVNPTASIAASIRAL